MLTYEMLDKDQLALVDRIYEVDETIVYATMGSGKTVCYLTAINELLNEKIINRVLVVAPLNPCKHVWITEHTKWEHLLHLNVALAVGNPEHRKRVIESDADIVVINIENLVWFLNIYGKNHNFDAICIDELSKFGDSSNKSAKKMRGAVKTFKHRVGLTGTPVHEGFIKLYSQVMMIDGGARLGTNKEKFLMRYFYPTDYNNYNWVLKPAADEQLLNKLGTLIYPMKDYTSVLPALIENRVNVTLSDSAAADYSYLVKNSVLGISGGNGVVIADNAAVLSGKLEQLANGFLYDDEGVAHNLHRHKSEAFKHFIKNNWDGDSVLIFYQYQNDKDTISKILTCLNIDYSTMDSKNGMQNFLNRTVPVLLLHPKSAGHGLNLHTGGARQILCYSPIWSHDQHKQLIGRLWRRGQTNPVNVTSFVSVNTIDETKLNRVLEKADYDKAFKEHLKSFN